MAKQNNADITVKQLYILPKYLDTERMKTLMAVGQGDGMPLYMHVSSSFSSAYANTNGFRP
jgi:hypothetical protein